MRSDPDIWREFLDFRIAECLGLWSEAIISLPFGRVVLLHPDDAPCLLMIGDLEAANPEEILAETEAVAGKFGLTAGYLLSSAWKGDVAAFEAYVREREYCPVFEQVWMIKEDFKAIDKIPESDFVIDTSPDSATVKNLYMRTLGASDSLAERLKRALDRGGGPIEVGFVVARAKSGEPVALGGYSHAGKISYLHCLGTLKEYQRHGIARHMAKVRYRMMRERGADYVVGAIEKQNTASVEMQKSLGYRLLETTMMWAKPAAK